MGKNVAVFVDVANIFYAAKAAGTDIDYVTLLKAAVAGRDLVRAYAYTGLDPENENQRNFHSFLSRHGYKVVSKDIRKYGDGKVKANLDIELVVDMMKTARNLDVAVVISGDGDFAPAIRAVQETGVRVEVISFRGNTSSDLIDVADAFYDITQLAKVDRDSSRSGRRVASDEEDLSMTEVPDKQTEGRGGRRGRGRRSEEAPSRVRSGRRVAALPGEKLARAAADGEEPEAAEADEDAAPIGERAEGEEQGGRRRRRRGGRGRGHHRGPDMMPEEGELEESEAASPPVVAANQFGSVWDSQIGMAGRPTRLSPEAVPEDEDYAEPEIPEYLLAERRRGGAGAGGGRGRGQGGRGARSAYASAVERERFGRSASRYPEPVRQPQPQRRRDERPRQPQPQQQRRGGQQRPVRSEEPWSEVPPEVEELLRAQLAAKLRSTDSVPAGNGGAPSHEAVGGSGEEAKPKARRTRKAAPAEAPAEAGAAEAAGPAKARTRRKTSAAEGPEGEAEAPAPKRRAPARKKAAAEPAGDAGSEPAGD